MKPDSQAAIDFLLRWAPDGPWVLTAIQTDRKAINTKTFGPGSLQALAGWLAEYNGKRNCYFGVNPPTKEMTKKTEREEIKSVDWLHVDLDARVGEDLEEEKVRILGRLTAKLPPGLPPPTVIVFSGGGYQGFWRLSDPIPIDGKLELAEDAKRYNQQLEVLLGGDNCHDISRIMRLPGTLNVPDAKKLKKGRRIELAKVVEFNDNIYATTEFVQAPKVQSPGDQVVLGGGGPKVEVGGNIARVQVEDLDEWNVPDRVKVIIVQGTHPNETKADNSRSSWVFDCCCQLVRSGVPDEVIYSILTDKDFGISESILDKGSNAHKYAIRQIGRAKEEAEDPWLRKLNERYAVIGNLGGKCRVVEEILDTAMNRTRLTRQSFEDFSNRYRHVKTKVGEDPKSGLPIMKKVGAWWLDHAQRRQFETLVFAPGREVVDAYNLWRGFSCVSRPGDCQLFIDHVRENICSNDETLFSYLMGWMATAVQHPARPGEVAVVMRGGRGTGKSVFAKVFGNLFGRHFLHVSNPAHLVGNFNSHLRDVIVLFADEAFYAGDRKHASILKTLITEDTITIEAKGVDAEASPNYIHLLMASNDMHVIPAGGDERRFIVLDVGKAHQQDSKYFHAIMKQMEEGGYEALLHMLLTYNLEGYQVRNVPQTDALVEQKLLSLSVEEEWWYNKLIEGRLLHNGDRWMTDVVCDDLVDDYINYTRRLNVARRGNATAVGRFLRRVVGPSLTRTQRLANVRVDAGDGFTKEVSKRRHFWGITDLADARARWAELYGKQEWIDTGDQAELPVSQQKQPF